jgi:hypothetical protein
MANLSGRQWARLNEIHEALMMVEFYEGEEKIERVCELVTEAIGTLLDESSADTDHEALYRG